MPMSPSDFSAAFTERLSQLSPEEMAALDAAITPEVGAILKKVLPEMTEVIDAVVQAGGQDASMGETSPEQVGGLGALG